MSLKSKIENTIQETRFKNRLIVLLVLIIGIMGYYISTFPSQIRIYTAPDISKAYIQTQNEVNKATIYGFARTLWENINYCKDDCAKDFPTNLKKYKAYLTSSCYTNLLNHHKTNQSLYSSRTRKLLPIPEETFDPDIIKQISSDVWNLPLTFLIDDDVEGINTRKEVIAYPLKVVRSNIPSQYNSWGLAIDCYYVESGPKYIRTEKNKG